MKNAAERGLFAPLPHPAERRFFKALSLLFPGRIFRLYNGEDSLRRALLSAGLSSGEREAEVWRPFLKTPPAGPLLVPVLPWPLSPLVLAAETGLDPRLPSGDLIAPVLLAAAARAVYDLIGVCCASRSNPLKIADQAIFYRTNSESSPDNRDFLRHQAQKIHKCNRLLAAAGRGGVRYPKVEKALAQKGCIWKQEGIYLRCRETVSVDAWAGIWKGFLDAGFLLPPDQDDPLILPGIMSPGEEAKLAACCRC
jgi:hypothetical protein